MPLPPTKPNQTPNSFPKEPLPQFDPPEESYPQMNSHLNLIELKKCHYKFISIRTVSTI